MVQIQPRKAVPDDAPILLLFEQKPYLVVRIVCSELKIKMQTARPPQSPDRVVAIDSVCFFWLLVVVCDWSTGTGLLIWTRTHTVPRRWPVVSFALDVDTFLTRWRLGSGEYVRVDAHVVALSSVVFSFRSGRKYNTSTHLD